MFNMIPELARVGIGIVLAVAALGKWTNLPWFVSVVTKYQAVPKRLAPVTALALAVSETLLAVAMIIGAWQPWPAFATFALLALFTLNVVINILRGRINLECGCFSDTQQKISWKGVLRNAAFMVLAVIGTGTLKAASTGVYIAIALSLVLIVFATISRRQVSTA